MEEIEVQTIQGVKKETVYNVNDFPYEELYKYETIRKYKQGEYYNITSAFDIESTTIEPPRHFSKLAKNGRRVYHYNETPQAFMYHWQWCIDTYVCFGRTWEEMQSFMQNLAYYMELNERKKLVTYIHNASYEFQFMKDFIKLNNVFAKEQHKVMKFDTVDGFEFRCSYFLSNMSLAKFCENCENVIYWKNEDNYDYRKIRTPYTPLTMSEKSYCYCDVRGLCECIADKLRYDNITTIPLTSTGYVRRDFRNAMKQNSKNREQFEKIRLNVEQYELCKSAFRGGNTHANRYLAGKTIPCVYSFDITSSYPSWINNCYFPIKAFTEIGDISSLQKLNYYLDNYCVLMKVLFEDVTCKNDNVIPYIPFDKIGDIVDKEYIENENGEKVLAKTLLKDNGRILYCKSFTMCMTEIDYRIIEKGYHIGRIKIVKAFYAERGKLPHELRNEMMKYYQQKTMLKDIEGKEYEYMKSKNKLNSTFGCMVTDIFQTDIIFNKNAKNVNEIWTCEKIETLEQKQQKLDKYYNSKNSFLSYQWGVWVTAHARQRLQNGIDIVGAECVYVDTDSVKFIGEHNIEKFEKLNAVIELESLNNDIPSYAERDGKKYILGLWDNETAKDYYHDFKTLGAKKYVYTHKGKFKITVSGMNKKQGAKVMGNVDNFVIGKTFNNIGRTVSWFNDCEPHTINIDNCEFTTGSNIAILDTTYTIGVSDDYLELIKDNYVNYTD